MNLRVTTCLSILAVLLSSGTKTLAQEVPPVLEGLPEHLIYQYTKKPVDNAPLSAREQLYASMRRWEPHRILRVCLFGGNQTVAKLIRDVASEWNSEQVSVKLDFGPDQTWNNCLSTQSGFFQIRIGFAERGYWSVLGRDSESLLEPLVPSMNLESFNRIYSESRFSPAVVVSQADPYHKATIRHEFGHALSLLHEHQNPRLKCHDQIKFSGANNVYDYFGGSPNFWSPAQVDRNLGFIGQTDPDYVAGDPDPRSVMMYALPKEIFVSGQSTCSVPVNHDLSPKDKAIVAKIYPKTPALAPASEVDVKTSNVKPLPQVVSESGKADLTSRILVDLESQDAYVRRDARVRLSDLMQKETFQQELSGLVQKMNGASYRYQLGVATAIANAPAKLRLDPATKQKLTEQANKASDSTLKRNLKSAVEALKH